VKEVRRMQPAADDPMTEFSRRILSDLFRSAAMGTLPAEAKLQSRQGSIPKSALAPSGEDFEQRLRGIRRLITVKEYCNLAHLHPETAYRRIKAGMPVERDGRNVKIYPPMVADWLLQCREARKNRMVSRANSRARLSAPATSATAE